MATTTREPKTGANGEPGTLVDMAWDPITRIVGNLADRKSVV